MPRSSLRVHMYVRAPGWGCPCGYIRRAPARPRRCTYDSDRVPLSLDPHYARLVILQTATPRAGGLCPRQLARRLRMYGINFTGARGAFVNELGIGSDF